MANIAFYCDSFLEHVIASAITRPNLPLITSVEFVQSFDSQVKNVIYLGSSKELKEVISSHEVPSESATFFTCDTEVDLMPLARKRGLNIIVTDLSLFDLHNRLSSVVRQYTEWRITLLETGNETQSIQKVIQAASRLSSSTLLLTNKAHQVVYSVVRDEERADRLVSELMASGKLSEETRTEVEAAEKRTTKPFGYSLPNNDPFVFFKLDVHRDGELLYAVYLVRKGGRPFFDGGIFLSMICDVIDAMTNSEGFRYWAGEDFKSFVEALMRNTITTSQEIQQRLNMLPVVPEKFCSFIVIDFEPADALPDPPAYFITQMENLFPNSNACIYNNTIVLLYGKPNRFRWKEESSFDNEKFEELLAENHACASISTPTSKLDALRSELILAQQVLRLGRQLRYSPEERVFFLDDYSEYVMIDLCYPHFKKIFGNDDLILFAHPDPVNLWRYDQANNDNLLDVLYYYCLCDLNVAKTAQMVYMHRNTVAAKLKKIEKVVVDDISDGQVQSRIILSYRIMRYLERCTPSSLSQRINIRPGEFKA